MSLVQKYKNKLNLSLLKRWGRWGFCDSYYLQSQMDLNPRSFWHVQEFGKIYSDQIRSRDTVKRKIMGLDSWDCARRDMLIMLLHSLLNRKVEGVMAELGVFQGQTARLIHHFVPERPLFLMDTFCGFNQQDLDQEKKTTGENYKTSDFSNTGLEMVRNFISPQNENVHFYPGFFPQVVDERMRNQRFSFVHLDADLYAPTLSGLEFFYSRTVPGGFIVVHDYNAWKGARQATDEFFKDKLEFPIPLNDKNGSALIVKYPQ